MLTLFTFTFAKRRVQCNIAHRFDTKIFTGNASLFASWQQALISERFKHKPILSLSFLNGNTGIIYCSLRFRQSMLLTRAWQQIDLNRRVRCQHSCRQLCLRFVGRRGNNYHLRGDSYHLRGDSCRLCGDPIGVHMLCGIGGSLPVDNEL